ncbi:MAG: FxsA family protein [Rhodospirillaceae bacterium]|nr:MAG: FxsA family protein [Rhodospirillaceae bacterium]
MAIVLLAAFIAVPVIEIALFIEVGGWIGLWSTVAIVILTAFAGTTLLRIQGLSVLQRAQESATRNELPVQEVFDGLCLLVAGVLLLTPGFFTDALGFTLFVPLFRELAGRGIWRWLKRHGHVHVGGFGRGFGGGPGGPSPGSRGAGPLIDGDFEEVNTPPNDRDRLPPKNDT